VRLGLYPSAEDYVGWPITPGFEFSGVVESLGALCEDSDFAVGDEVFGVVRFFAYATHVEVPLSQLRKKPASLSFEQAAAMPVAALTAWYALREQGQAKAGYQVLVHSAAGGVGSTLVQLARLLGCQVTAVVGSSHKVDLVRELGAQTVIDRSASNWSQLAQQAVPEGFDLVLDANGVQTLRDSYRLLRPTGRLVVYGAHSMLTRGSGRPNWFKLAWDFLRTPRFNPLDLTNQNKSIMAFNLSYLFNQADLLKESFDQLTAWYAEGQLRVAEIHSFPLSAAAEAHRTLQGGATRGKLVLITQ
jgi:synaptic vesicle membrane protein VAT-1